MSPPVGHEVRAQRWPYVTICLVALNVLAFLFELSLGGRLVDFFQRWGVLAGRMTAAPGAHDAVTVLSAMFLHVGWLQLLVNVVFLLVFGDAVEEALGPWWFLGLYVVSGLVATLAVVGATSGAVVPMAGADGAIAGVVAASVTLWPRARIGAPAIVWVLVAMMLSYVAMVAVGVPSLVLGGPVVFVVGTLLTIGMTRKGGHFLVALTRVVEVSAASVLVVYVSLGLLNGMYALVGGGFGGGVAWWARIAGGVAGALVVVVIPKEVRPLRARSLLE